jgi:Ca2+-binding EF-hand superfamily protein
LYPARYKAEITGLQGGRTIKPLLGGFRPWVTFNQPLSERNLTMSAISGVSGSSNAWAAASSQRSQHQAKMFAKADSDNSGGVNTSELSTMLSDISQKTGMDLGDSSELFAKMDSDGDGNLTTTELDEGMKANVPPPPSTMDFAQSRGMSSTSASGGVDEKADALFASVDANGDGALDTDEMDALMARIQSDTGEDVSDQIAALDSDGDGSLSRSEFDAGKPSGPQGAAPAGGPPPGGGPGGASSASASSDTTYDALDTNEDGTVSIMERLAGTLEDMASTSDSDSGSSSDSDSGFKAEVAKFAQALYQQISSNNSEFTSAFSATA